MVGVGGHTRAAPAAPAALAGDARKPAGQPGDSRAEQARCFLAPGLAKMIAAYREGATTDEAIQRLSGVSVAEFDTHLRAWGRTGTKVFENKEFVSYEHQQPDDIHWTRQGGHR